MIFVKPKNDYVQREKGEIKIKKFKFLEKM